MLYSLDNRAHQARSHAAAVDTLEGGHDLLQHMSMTLVNQVQYSEVVEPAWCPMHEEWRLHGTGTSVSLQRNPPVRTLLVARHFWMGPM